MRKASSLWMQDPRQARFLQLNDASDVVQMAVGEKEHVDVGRGHAKRLERRSKDRRGALGAGLRR